MTYPSEDEIETYPGCNNVIWGVLFLFSLAAACYAIHINATLANKLGMEIMVTRTHELRLDALEKEVHNER